MAASGAGVGGGELHVCRSLKSHERTSSYCSAILALCVDVCVWSFACVGLC